MKPVTPASPHVIIMVGIPGAGKSAFAEHFADTFKTPLVNQTKIARDNDLQPLQSARIARVLLDEILKTRRTLFFEGETGTKKQREALVKYIVEAGYQPLTIWVQTESVEAKRRATKAYPAGSGLTPDEFDAAISSFEAPGVQENAVVISGKHTYASQLKIVLRQLATERPEVKLPPRSTAQTKRTLLR